MTALPSRSADTSCAPDHEGEPGRAPDGQEGALVAALQFLAATVDVVTPGTSAGELLACLTRYREHLAAVVTACSR